MVDKQVADWVAKQEQILNKNRDGESWPSEE